MKRGRLAGAWLVLAILGLGTGFATELQTFTNVHLVDHPWSDGDSFIVRSGERQFHVRLYFVDCPESVAATDADAKRVREQAAYFGITDPKRVFAFGKQARKFTVAALQKPFTVHTAFAGAMGRSPGGRVYAFVTTGDGQDLGRLLVENGLGRTYGSKRKGPDQRSPESIQRELLSAETEAMLQHKGVWAASDPGMIAQLRAKIRAEEQELREIQRASAGKVADPSSVDLNTATSQELQQISGIGPTLAAKIIEGRPYQRVDDLLRVKGMGPRLFDKVKPYLVVQGTAPLP